MHRWLIGVLTCDCTFSIEATARLTVCKEWLDLFTLVKQLLLVIVLNLYLHFYNGIPDHACDDLITWKLISSTQTQGGGSLKHSNHLFSVFTVIVQRRDNKKSKSPVAHINWNTIEKAYEKLNTLLVFKLQ